jgi:hypothetical protein
MVGAREWRCRLSRGKDDDKVAYRTETGRERDYRTDSDISRVRRLDSESSDGSLAKEHCMSIATQSRSSNYTNKRQQGSEVTKYSTVL